MQIQISEQTFFSISQLRGNLDYLQKKFYNNHHNWFQYVYLWQKYQFITNLNCYIRYFYNNTKRIEYGARLANFPILNFLQISAFSESGILRFFKERRSWGARQGGIPDDRPAQVSRLQAQVQQALRPEEPRGKGAPRPQAI